MRILLSVPSMARGKGGAEKTAAKLANALDENGHSVGVICNGDEKSEPTYPLNKNVTFIGADYSRMDSEKVAEALKPVTKFKPEAVIIFYADISILWQLEFFRKTNAAIFVQECTSPVRAVRNLMRGLKSAIPFKTAFLTRQAIFENVDGIRLVMPSYRDSVAPLFRSKTVAFYNNPGEIVSREHGGLRDKHKIMCVGGLKDFNKNGITAARAFASIAPQYPNWELHFFGVNRFAGEIKALNKLPGMRHRIIDRGIVDGIEKDYLTADFSLMCSFEEGNPNVVNESMLHGVPVIGYEDCAGFKGLATDRKDSLVINREPEIANLAAAMRELIESPKLLKELSNGAYETMKARPPAFTYLKTWEKLIRAGVMNRGGQKHKKYLGRILENVTRLYRG